MSDIIVKLSSQNYSIPNGQKLDNNVTNTDIVGSRRLLADHLIKKEDSLPEGKIKLLTKPQRQKLEKNFLKNDAIIQEDGYPIDFKPVVKLFTPDAQCTWLLTELNPVTNIALGLCDLGHGEPEIGYVDLAELKTLRGKLGLPVERDRWFVADKTLSEYAKLAREKGSINA
jgi:hypothetical protein